MFWFDCSRYPTEDLKREYISISSRTDLVNGSSSRSSNVSPSWKPISSTNLIPPLSSFNSEMYSSNFASLFPDSPSSSSDFPASSSQSSKDSGLAEEEVNSFLFSPRARSAAGYLPINSTRLFPRVGIAAAQGKFGQFCVVQMTNNI